MIHFKYHTMWRKEILQRLGPYTILILRVLHTLKPPSSSYQHKQCSYSRLGVLGYRMEYIHIVQSTSLLYITLLSTLLSRILLLCLLMSDNTNNVRNVLSYMIGVRAYGLSPYLLYTTPYVDLMQVYCRSSVPVTISTHSLSQGDYHAKVHKIEHYMLYRRYMDDFPFWFVIHLESFLAYVNSRPLVVPMR